MKKGDRDERFYTARGKLFRATFEWDGKKWVYIKGSLMRYRGHDQMGETSFAEIFKEEK